MTASGSWTFEERLESARAVVPELAGIAGIVGAYFFGSGSRPYADPRSDLDVGVVVEEPRLAAVATALKEPRARLHAQRVDLSYWPDTFLTRPRNDADRYAISRYHILHDPDGVLAAAQARFAVIPDDVRQVRLRIYYFEVSRLMHQVVKAGQRDNAELATLLIGTLVTSTAKLLFVEQGMWPSPASWMRRELELLQVPLTASLFELLRSEWPAVRLFRHHLNKYLLGRGHAFVGHPQCFLENGHFAGSDAERLAAFREVAQDSAVDAVWFARGDGQ